MSCESYGIRGLTLAAVLALTAATGLNAQQFAPRESVTVVPGAQYKAGGIHRLFFGSHYRSLWLTPIRVPVLRLSGFAGGLTPTQRGGGQQTKSLRLRGADGHEYQFRSVTKDPSAILPPELRGTLADRILQDQMSAGHPAGMVVVPVLLDSVGVLHTRPILVQLADDPALGDYRKEFANMLGTIEERPDKLAGGGFSIPGVTAIENTDEVFKKLDEHPGESVDARQFLLARLTDVVMGDWDRHADQWRWARVTDPDGDRWLPIPRDRDQAFVRYDGIMPSYARRSAPQILDFGPKYGQIVGATWNGRNLDRRFLTGLDRRTWDSVGAVLKSRLSDRAIASAVGQMPVEFRRLDAARMEHALRNRRDHIDKMVNQYYRLLAENVDIYASDKSDDARVTRNPDGTTTVTVAHDRRVYYRRTFTPRETKGIRIYLHGGDDKITVEGRGKSSPTVRVVGGKGDDQFTITRSGGIHLYDDKGTNRAEGASINSKTWEVQVDSTDPKALPPRDWGTQVYHRVTGSFGSDIGALIDYGGFTNFYGFRRVPYSTRLDYQLQYATGKNSLRFIGGITRQLENSRGFWKIDALASGIETLRWYGTGNETTQNGQATDFFKVNQNQFGLGFRLGTRFGTRNTFSIGPEVRWSQTNLGKKPNRDRFIATDQPYGTGDFGMLGAGFSLVVDGRDFPGFATKGAYLMLTASAFPKAWDVRETMARAQAEGSVTLAPNGSWKPSLTLFAGGIKTFGDVPFFETARLGGNRILRGYRPDRFAGSAAVYGSAELRLPVTRLQIVIPGEQGIFAFADAGRVYQAGESSDELHSSLGGGIWLSFLGRGNVLYVGAGVPKESKEGARVIAGFGFPF